MIRHPTVNKIFHKSDLYRIVLNSIRATGWESKPLNSFDDSPLKILITNGEEQEIIAVYIWNITHGGKTRTEGEYRIQIHGEGTLEISDKFKTLLLGWFEENKVFAAFDAIKHKDFGKSPSVQVSKSNLDAAMKHNVAMEIKTSKTGEYIVVAFSPEYIMQYIQDIYPQYHTGNVSTISKNEIAIIQRPVENSMTPEELSSISKGRRIAINTIKMKVRERKFQLGIYQLYKGKCAICGLQARLTEASHIIPVGEDGSDEIVNGILLCRNHHKAYDSGLLAIDKNYTVMLNQIYEKSLIDDHLNDKLAEFIKDSRIGEPIYLPDSKEFYPKLEYLAQNCKSKGLFQ